MRETNAGTVGEMHVATHLILLIFHQCLVSDGMDFTHVHVRVFVRVEYALGENCMCERSVSEANAKGREMPKIIMYRPKYFL